MKSILLGFCCMLVVWPATRAASQSDRVAIFATLPDWRGIWETDWGGRLPPHPGRRLQGFDDQIQALRQRVALLGHPPYNDEWEAQHQAMLDDPASLMAMAEVAKDCSSGGFPTAMGGPQLFQITITPEETLLVFDSGEVRHVYTDGRAHPGAADIWPTRMGDSIGEWQQDSLVIDTIARAPGPIFPGPAANLGAEAHFTERLRLVDADTIESVMTIDDPQRFTQPWQLVLHFHRVRELDRLIPWGCENDRNPVVDGKLTIAAP